MMDRLLPLCRNVKILSRDLRMVSLQNTHVHMEGLEDAQD